MGREREDAAYIRWSTERQSDRLTKADQLRILKRLEEVHGLRFKDSRIYVDDAEHSDDLTRPALTRLLKACKAGNIKTIAAAYDDRLLRGNRLMKLIRLFCKAYDITLIFGNLGKVTDEMGALLDMYASQGEGFLKLVRDRTKAALATAKEAGIRVGRPPSGLTTTPDKKSWILTPTGRKIEELHKAGNSAEAIRDEGLKYGTGKRVNATVTLTFVKRVIRNVTLHREGELENFLADGGILHGVSLEGSRDERRDDWKAWWKVRAKRRQKAERDLEDLIPIEFLQQRASY